MELRSGKIVSEFKTSSSCGNDKHQCATALKLLQHRTEYYIKQLDHVRGNTKEKERIIKHIELCRQILSEGKRAQVSLERIHALNNTYKTIAVSTVSEQFIVVGVLFLLYLICVVCSIILRVCCKYA